MDTQQDLDVKAGYDAMIEWEKGIVDYNNRVLKAIKSVKGDDFYNDLLDVIKESEGVQGKVEFVNNPIGNYQDEDESALIKGIWVNQTTNGGYTGDTFAGSVCVQLKPNKYLKFYYSM